MALSSLPPLDPTSGGGGVSVVPINPDNPYQLPSVSNGPTDASVPTTGTHGIPQTPGFTPKPSNGINIPQSIGQGVLGLGYDIEQGILTFYIYGIFAALFLMLVWVLVADKDPIELVQQTASNAKEASKNIPVIPVE